MLKRFDRLIKFVTVLPYPGSERRVGNAPDQLGMVRGSYEVFKMPGELVLYCEHLQTVNDRDPATFAARTILERLQLSSDGHPGCRIGFQHQQSKTQ